MSIVRLILECYLVILFARAVLSWFPIHPGSGAYQFARALDKVTEPVLAPVRRLLPPVRAGGIGIDLSFMIVFVVILIVIQIL